MTEWWVWHGWRGWGTLVWLFGDLLFAWQMVEEDDSPLAQYPPISRVVLGVSSGLLWPLLLVAVLIERGWERVRR